MGAMVGAGGGEMWVIFFLLAPFLQKKNVRDAEILDCMAPEVRPSVRPSVHPSVLLLWHMIKTCGTCGSCN